MRQKNLLPFRNKSIKNSSILLDNITGRLPAKNKTADIFDSKIDYLATKENSKIAANDQRYSYKMKSDDRFEPGKELLFAR